MTAFACIHRSGLFLTDIAGLQPHVQFLAVGTPHERNKKCVDVLCTTNRKHWEIRNTLALCYISQVSGGEHPPNFTVLVQALCEACWRCHGRNAKGQKQHL